MVIAMIAAVITSLIVPPDQVYLEYFDFKTLTCLFCVLAVVCALKNINFFYILAKKLIQVFRNTPPQDTATGVKTWLTEPRTTATTAFPS